MKTYYLAKNPFLLFFLKICDSILPKVPSKKLEHPKKILLTNLAHMGDVVITTSVLEPLKKRYPGVEIGFLVASFSKGVLEEHPLISHIHIFDHWKLNRASFSFWKKIFLYFKTKKQAIQEIKRVNYDAAIDLYPYFPNASWILFRTGISCRVGYTSGGFGSLFTDPVSWEEKTQSIARYQADLLGIQEEVFPSLKEEPFEVPEAFAILHMGTGDPKREVEAAVWKRTIEYFAQNNYPVFLTGRGKREKERIEQLIAEVGYGTSLCDQLTWKQLVFLIQKAKLMISTETVVMHIASCFKTPNIIVSPHLQRLWTPDNPCCSVIEEKNIIKKLQEVLTP
ncbi:MAG: glycosyltransferase family 9 protein [Chlamydiota bacterium]